MEENKVNSKKIKISLIINVMIVVFTVIASIMMFTGFKFTPEAESELESTKLSMLKFFTVESNLLMGIVALIFAIQEIKLLNGKIEDISFKMYILKLMSTTAVGLTFVVVFAYLGPISKGGIPVMLRNSNLFFHLLIPVISMMDFAFFEKTDKIKLKHTLYGLIPTALYEVFYLSNIFIHMENGKVSPVYDWYWFVQIGVWTAAIVAPLILVITYIISWILWKLNQK
ncbi:MAG: hypothetical protein IJ867_00210 [Clostridia bacterium]|nr:hypothetical protein [Clostridia bacterium]